RFIDRLEIAQKEGKINKFESWEDIEVLPTEVQADMLGSYSPNYKNVSDFFTIIPSSQREFFQLGQLVFISSKPFDQSEWRKDLIRESELTEEDIDALLLEYDNLNTEEEIVRWYATATENSDYVIQV